MASGHQTQRTVDFPIDKESPQQLDQCLSDTTHACSEDVCLEGETSRRSVPVPGNQTKSITADPTTCIVVLNKQLRLLAVPQGPVQLAHIWYNINTSILPRPACHYQVPQLL